MAGRGTDIKLGGNDKNDQYKVKSLGVSLYYWHRKTRE